MFAATVFGGVSDAGCLGLFLPHQTLCLFLILFVSRYKRKISNSRWVEDNLVQACIQYMMPVTIESNGNNAKNGV